MARIKDSTEFLAQVALRHCGFIHDGVLEEETGVLVCARHIWSLGGVLGYCYCISSWMRHGYPDTDCKREQESTCWLDVQHGKGLMYTGEASIRMDTVPGVFG